MRAGQAAEAVVERETVASATKQKLTRGMRPQRERPVVRLSNEIGAELYEMWLRLRKLPDSELPFARRVNRRVLTFAEVVDACAEAGAREMRSKISDDR